MRGTTGSPRSAAPAALPGPPPILPQSRLPTNAQNACASHQSTHATGRFGVDAGMKLQVGANGVAGAAGICVGPVRTRREELLVCDPGSPRCGPRSSRRRVPRDHNHGPALGRALRRHPTAATDAVAPPSPELPPAAAFCPPRPPAPARRSGGALWRGRVPPAVADIAGASAAIARPGRPPPFWPSKEADAALAMHVANAEPDPRRSPLSGSHRRATGERPRSSPRSLSALAAFGQLLSFPCPCPCCPWAGLSALALAFAICWRACSRSWMALVRWPPNWAG